MNAPLRIGFFESWRKEFRDLIHSLSLAPETVVIKLSSRTPISKREADIILVSDDRAFFRELDGFPPVLRIYWNGATEILKSFEISPHSGDTYLTFFTDVAEQISPLVPTAYIPFAFSRPGLIIAPTVSRIGYVGEVDISDQCFHAYGTSFRSHLVESIKDSSLRITVGDQTLCAVLGNPPAEIQDQDDLVSIWKWSLLNWVRWRFVSSLVAAFPGRFELRGNDWINLGFQAKKSRYHPLVREFSYARNAVSVDFGSKSTTDCIYPRSTEIIANRGGQLQLNSGVSPPQLMPEVASRRFISESQLLTMADQKLSQNQNLRNESDKVLRQELEAQRKIATRALIEICLNLSRKSS